MGEVWDGNVHAPPRLFVAGLLTPQTQAFLWGPAPFDGQLRLEVCPAGEKVYVADGRGGVRAVQWWWAPFVELLSGGGTQVQAYGSAISLIDSTINRPDCPLGVALDGCVDRAGGWGGCWGGWHGEQGRALGAIDPPPPPHTHPPCLDHQLASQEGGDEVHLGGGPG